MLRTYSDNEYDQLKALYQHTEWYGGVFDEGRDGRERLATVVENDSHAILVYEEDARLKGTISIIEDGRVAMLYRFVVEPDAQYIAKELYEAAVHTLKSRGHEQVLVYSDPNSTALDERYSSLGMTRGGDYACFWANI